MLIDTRVSDNLDLIDGRRLTFVHTHLEINRVIRYVHFHRFYIEEQVSAVGVQFAHRIVVSRQTVVEGLKVIDVTRFDTERHIQNLVRINGVTHPLDRTNVVLVTFADGHIDIDARRIFGVRYHAIGYDIRVTITVLIVFLYHRLLVFFI